MRRIVLGICVLAFLAAFCSSAQRQFRQEDFQRADQATVRLKPSDFPGLPSDVRIVLERRGCTIPQTFNAGGQMQNVIRGRFKSASQTDTAVLCSQERRSVILVFYGGTADDVHEIAERPDSEYLQVVSGSREIGYSRQLAVATPDAIRRHLTRSAQVARSVDHDGIEDIFLEKGSVVWFLSGGKWMRLDGAD